MSTAPRATDLDLVSCTTCGLIVHQVQSESKNSAQGYCPRCDAPLHRRKPKSQQRCWAYLIAAMVLYIPANVLPIMHTTELLDREDSTILSGIGQLWRNGSWDLAIIVFIASIVVPVLKIITLLLLLITTGRGSRWRRRERTRLYRIVDYIGHWSMLDVFVVILLVTLVHFNAFAKVEPGGGVIAFGGVVILTMLASMSFDPKLIWDAQEAAAEPLPGPLSGPLPKP